MGKCDISKMIIFCHAIADASGDQDDFIPLVDEVRFKRPDLFGADHNSSGSVQFDGVRLTPLATPPCHRLENFEESVATSGMKGMAVELTSPVESTSSPPWLRRSLSQVRANKAVALRHRPV